MYGFIDIATNHVYYNTKVILFRSGRKFHLRHFHILAGLNMHWTNQGFEAHLQVEYSGLG